MNRRLAEAYELAHLCPLCMYTGTEEAVQDHMEHNHTNEQMLELTGWDMKDFED